MILEIDSSHKLDLFGNSTDKVEKMPKMVVDDMAGVEKRDKASVPTTPLGLELNASVGQVTEEFVLSRDGLKLFPQPVLGDDLDPLNWSSVQKHTILAIVMSL